MKKYQNNKPYITRGIRECINKKKLAFNTGDRSGVRAAQKDLNQQLRIAWQQYKVWEEEKLSNSNTKKLWDTIRGITNMDTKKNALATHKEGGEQMN